LNGFHIYKQKAYFIASDGTNYGNLYVTDGTSTNTNLVKTLISGATIPLISLLNSINLPDKFIFSVSDGTTRSELWQSDGTGVGTTLFKSFDFSEDFGVAFLFKNYSILGLSENDVLFQGNTFFFSATTATEGNELWKSDGTITGTSMVKNIGSGITSGIGDSAFSYLYTLETLFFVAKNGTQGIELWRSNGTEAGTTIVQDIRTGQASSEPQLMVLHNGKVYFGANDGVMPAETDLYVVDGIFTPLPTELSTFSVLRKGADAIIEWETLSENNSSHVDIERSNNGSTFNVIGSKKAAGQSYILQKYSFTDPKIVFPPSGKLYYRLVTYDKDGSKAYSKVVTLSGKPGGWNARLLSNTIGGDVTLQLEGLETTASIRISDISGRIWLTREYDARQWQINLPVQSLARGVYLVMVYHEGEVKTLRFVK